MLVICLPFKDWKNNARLPKYLKRISYSMWNIYLVEIRNFNRKFEKKIAESKKLNKNKAKLNTTPRYLNLCIWTSQANGLSKFSCSFLFQSSSFLDSYLPKWSQLHSMHMWWQTHKNRGHELKKVRVIILHPFSLRQEIQHHKIVSSQPYKDTL